MAHHELKMTLWQTRSQASWLCLCALWVWHGGSVNNNVRCRVHSKREILRTERAASAFSLATLQSEQSQVENCALLAEPVPSVKCVWQVEWKREGAATALDTYPTGRDRKEAQALFNISKNVIKMRHFFQHLGHKNNEIFISSFRRMSQSVPVPLPFRLQSVHPT